MTYDETTETFRLSTGRRFMAPGGVIGLPTDKELVKGFALCAGYDAVVDGTNVEDSWGEEPWTMAERREVAEHMIAAWTAYRDKCREPEP